MKQHGDRLLIKSQNHKIDLVLKLQDMPAWKIKQGDNCIILVSNEGREVELHEKNDSFVLACCSSKCEAEDYDGCPLQRLHKDIQTHWAHTISSAVVPNLNKLYSEEDAVKN